eukprot:9095342-Pyramimonas_sp.AAC.1
MAPNIASRMLHKRGNRGMNHLVLEESRGRERGKTATMHEPNSEMLHISASRHTTHMRLCALMTRLCAILNASGLSMSKTLSSALAHLSPS